MAQPRGRLPRSGVGTRAPRRRRQARRRGPLLAAAAAATEGVAEGRTAQALPLAQVDVTVVPEKEMLASGILMAVATACLAATKLVPVSAAILLLAATRAPAAVAGMSTGTVMAR